MLGQQPESLAMLDGKKCRGATEKRGRAGNVATRERAAAGGREPPRRVLADLPAAVVERPELGEVPPRLLEVVAEDLLELDSAVAVRLVGPRDEARVQVGPRPLQDPVVRGVADHDVVETVRAVRAVLDPPDEVLLRERRELGAYARGDVRGRQGGHGGLGEHVAHDGCGLDHRPLAPRQRVEPRREKRLDRRRNLDVGQLLGEPPRTVHLLDGALVDEHAEQLLGEQRVAFGRRHDAVEHGGVERAAAEQALDHALRVVVAERLEDDAARTLAGAPGRRLLEQLGAGRAEDQDRCVDRLDEMLDQREQRRLGPVDVLHDEDDLPVGGEVREEAPHRPEQLLDGERLDGQPERRRESRRDAVARRVGERGKLRCRLRCVVVVDDPGLCLHRLGDRPERDAVAVRQAAPAEREGTTRCGLEELRREPRLADPGIAGQRDESAASRRGRLVQRARKRRELLAAADERRASPIVRRRRVAHRDEPVGRHGLGLPLQLERLDLLDLDLVPDEAVGQLAEEHLALPGGLLETGGDVDGVAGHQALAARGVAGHDLARVDARAVRELHAVDALQVVVERLERRLHPRGRADRAKRVVLVEPRQPEDGHHCVADELLDHATVPFELAAHRVEVARHHLAERLGVERLAEARRALQIREDDRHDLSRLLRRPRLGELRAAREAEPRNVRVLGAARRTDLHAASLRTAVGRSRRTETMRP